MVGEIFVQLCCNDVSGTEAGRTLLLLVLNALRYPMVILIHPCSYTHFRSPSPRHTHWTHTIKTDHDKLLCRSTRYIETTEQNLNKRAGTTDRAKESGYRQSPLA